MRPHIKSFIAGGAITANAFVKFSAARTVVLAAAATDAILGVSTEVAAAAGDMVDVVFAGEAQLKCSGTPARGGFVTADAAGLGVACAPGAGTVARYGAIALETAAANDIIPVTVMVGQLTTPV